MRWFIEVSRVGDDTPIDKYCLEAKQWQAALQEARKLRGDAGPLSKFSIELLDNGYRAVDPSQQIRYVVSKAPGDSLLAGPPAEQAPALAFPAPAKVPSISAAPVIQDSGPATDPMAAPQRNAGLLAEEKTDPMHPSVRTDPLATADAGLGMAQSTTQKMKKVAPAPSAKNAKAARPAIVVPEDPVPRATRSSAPPTTLQPSTA